MTLTEGTITVTKKKKKHFSIFKFINLHKKKRFGKFKPVSQYDIIK